MGMTVSCSRIRTVAHSHQQHGDNPLYQRSVPVCVVKRPVRLRIRRLFRLHLDAGPAARRQADVRRCNSPGCGDRDAGVLISPD